MVDDSGESDEEADSPEPVSRPYQTAVKNRALQADVEIMEEECNDPQYKKGEDSSQKAGCSTIYAPTRYPCRATCAPQTMRHQNG